MPYIGRGPSKSGAFRILKDFSASFNGSTTSFAIQDTNGTALSVATPQNLMIAVDGVLQEPGSAYTISGTNIVFGSAPQDSATFWGVELGDIGGTSVSSSDQILVTATGHSFVVGRWMKATSTDGVYAYADCTTEANAEVAGVIISTTTDTYTLQVHGTVTGDAVPAQASGTIMFLDASNGQMTTTETSTAGRVSKPLAIVTKNDSEMVILTYRGEVISSNVQTNAPNDATYLTTTANGTLTAEVVVGTSPGGELGGTWASPTIDDNIIDEANLKVSNSPTNGYFLSAQSGNTGGLTWAAVAASAISREGGTTTEATTTSTSAMDLITMSSLTIAAASPWTMTSLWRKTTGHASAASGGLKIVADSTVVTGESTTAATLWQSGTSNLAEDGGTDTTVGAKVTNYLASNAQNNIVSRNSSSGGFTYGNVGTLTKDAVFPVGQTTSIVLRANSGNASVTTGSDEIHIYVLSVS